MSVYLQKKEEHGVNWKFYSHCVLSKTWYSYFMHTKYIISILVNRLKWGVGYKCENSSNAKLFEL